MKHRTFAPAIGALAALFLTAGVPFSASAADPSGIWAKEDELGQDGGEEVRPRHLQQDRLAEVA